MFRSPLAGLGVRTDPRPISAVRQLIGITSIIRWIGLVAGAVMALVAPARTPALIGLVILGVAAYNAWSSLAIRRARDADVPRIARTVTMLDALCCLLFIAAFKDFPGGAQSALYVPILIEAVAYEGVEGAALALVTFILGILAISAWRAAFFREPFAWTTVVTWSLIMAVIAVALVIFGQAQQGPAGEEPTGGASLRAAPDGSTVHLSPRELEVLRLIAEGNSNGMIAQRLHLSETTIKTYVETLLVRLDARNRAEAVAAASRLNLL